MVTLNTGWKTWDMYLSPLVGRKQLKVIEVGSFKGDASVWILNNLFTDNKSKLYAIDTFANSQQNTQEYGDLDFKDVEVAFRENIKKTGKSRQVVVIKEYSHMALSRLMLKKSEQESFDFIYIDASHDAIDVMTDACLAWKLLKPEGIMIFDDYEWDIFHQEFFRPKMAIDAFIEIYKSELYIIHVQRQVFVQKRPHSKFIKPIKNLHN